MSVEEDIRDMRIEIRENSGAVGNLSGRVIRVEERNDALHGLNLPAKVPELERRLQSTERHVEELRRAQEDSGSKLRAQHRRLEDHDRDIRTAKRMAKTAAGGVFATLALAVKALWNKFLTGGF